LTLPPRAAHAPWLYERSLNMVYGPRGVGKTFFLLELALRLATGKPFLAWPIRAPVGVLYVDGEMALDDLRTRAITLAGEMAPERLAFLPSELVYTRSGCDLTLTAEKNRALLEILLEAHQDLRVVVLDNVSCLFPGMNEDKKQDWEPINA